MATYQTYDITVGGEDVKLRLTFLGQINLKKKHKAEALAVIFDGIADIEKAVDVFTQALTYKGNENTIKTGEELYDKLVDDGMTGYDGIAKILSGIAVHSGLITQQKADQIVAYMTTVMDAQFNALTEADEEPKNS